LLVSAAKLLLQASTPTLQGEQIMATKTNTQTPTTTPADELTTAIEAAKTAIDAVVAATLVDGAVTKANATEFAGAVNELVADLQGSKKPFERMLRVVASNASRAKRAERVARALALLEATESQDEEVVSV
jgi:hypothetical protein